MKRIVWHHTGGKHRPNNDDLDHYHRIVDGDAVVHQGKFPISANAAGRRLTPNSYAAHTRNLNTDAIGLAAAAMFNAQWSNPRDGAFFPRVAQMDALIRQTAEDCRTYGIPVSRETTLSHAEVEITLGIDQASKWDFDYDPYGILTTRDPIEIGDRLRDRTALALRGLGYAQVTPTPDVYPLLKRGSTGEQVREVQARLKEIGFDPKGVDGQFGPGTYAAVVAFQSQNELLPDGKVGRLTRAALFAA